MAVEPEEVLVRHRVAVELGIKDADVHRPFSDQQQQRDAQNGSRQHLNDAGRIDRPQAQRHLEPRHPRWPHRVDRHDQVQAGEDRAEAKDKGPEGRENHRRVGRRAVWRVDRPTGVEAAGQQGRHQEDRSPDPQVKAR